MENFPQLIADYGVTVAALVYLGWLTFKQSETLQHIAVTLTEIKDAIAALVTRVDKIEDKLDMK